MDTKNNGASTRYPRFCRNISKHKTLFITENIFVLSYFQEQDDSVPTIKMQRTQ